MVHSCTVQSKSRFRYKSLVVKYYKKKEIKIKQNASIFSEIKREKERKKTFDSLNFFIALTCQLD